MKLGIYSEKKQEDVVRLRLVESWGEIKLVAVDEDGNMLKYGYILTVTDRGTVRLHNDCKVPGIQTDDDGRILIIE